MYDCTCSSGYVLSLSVSLSLSMYALYVSHTSHSGTHTGWVLSQPAVASVIIGVRLGKSDRSNSNKEIFRVSQELTKIHLDRIDAVRMKPIPGDCGDEYRKEPFLTATGDLSEHLEDANKALFELYKFNSSGTRIGSGTFWENKFAYSRAVRTSQGQIHVAGTTATHRNTSIGNKAFCGFLSQSKDEKSGYLLQPGVYVEGESEILYDLRDGSVRNDPYAQAVFTLDKIEGALYVLGATLKSVVRTRLIVSNVERDWHACALAHGERFRGLNPANTLIGAPLVGKEFSVEIEVDAVLDSDSRRRSSWLARVLFFTGVTLAGVTLGAVMRHTVFSTRRKR